MDLPRKLELLDQRVDLARKGNPEDFTAWQKGTEVVLRLVMGEGSSAHAEFQAVSYSPGVMFSGMDTSGYRPAGVRRGIAILNAAKEELVLAAELQKTRVPVRDSETSDASGQLVFIVHGRDSERKLDFARTIQNLIGAEPTILHEQPNAGQVLIEKFEQSAGRAGFAVILLTADDVGRAKDEKRDAPRARQNVVFEMGFFFGSLGRGRVAVFLDSGVEEPGDVRGIVYTAIDRAGAWKMHLARELTSAGYEVDWSGLK